MMFLRRAVDLAAQALEAGEEPFGSVLVSHGEPVHTRAEFEAALDRAPWSEVEGG